MFLPGRFLAASVLAAAIALSAQGCSDSSAGGTGVMQIKVTDAPSDYIESAQIYVSRVYIQGGEEDDAARIDLFNDPANPKSFDLLDLQNGITAELTEEMTVPAGEYHQLRLIVDSARVTLKAPYTFNSGGNTALLFVPSGMQTGIKVTLDESLDLGNDEVMIVLVDIDVDENFVIMGNPLTTAGIDEVKFTPVLKQKQLPGDDQDG
jgi:hypothetical protein